MKTRFLILTLLSFAVSTSFASGPYFQTGYCTYVYKGKTHILSYFSSKSGVSDYFTDQGLTIEVTHGKFGDNLLEGQSESPGHPNCNLKTYVRVTERTNQQSFQAKIYRRDFCGRFVFSIPVVENANCFQIKN